MELEFERSAQGLGKSIAIVIPQEMVRAMAIEPKERITVIGREMVINGKKRSVGIFWKTNNEQ